MWGKSAIECLKSSLPIETEPGWWHTHTHARRTVRKSVIYSGNDNYSVNTSISDHHAHLLPVDTQEIFFNDHKIFWDSWGTEFFLHSEVCIFCVCSLTLSLAPPIPVKHLENCQDSTFQTFCLHLEELLNGSCIEIVSDIWIRMCRRNHWTNPLICQEAVMVVRWGWSIPTLLMAQYGERLAQGWSTLVIKANPQPPDT